MLRVSRTLAEREREEAVGGAASSARGPSAQDFQHTGTVGPNVTEFHDTDLEAEKTYHYHVIACNQNDCSTPSPVSQDAATHSELLITTTNLADGVVGMAYDGLVEATGGDGTFSWGLSAGALPDGLTLSAAGAITGTPTVASQFDFTVQVEGGGQTVTADLSIAISGLLVCAGTPSSELEDSNFADTDWNAEVAYQTNQSVLWTFVDGQKTTPGPGTVPAGNPQPGRWVQLALDNPAGLSTGVGVVSEHVPARIPGGFGSVRVEFDVWATTVRVQAYIKDTENDTYYGIPRELIVDEADGWVRIESECGVSGGMAKIGGQTGQGPDRPDFSHDFEIGYITQASGPGTASVRNIVVDNWRVRVWR